MGHHRRVSENEKSPVEQALDLFVYAPLGLALEAPSLLPKLVERGRAQVGMAKMIGQFAVQQGEKEAGKAVGSLQKQAAGLLEAFFPGTRPEPAAAPTEAPGPAPAPVADAEPAPATAVLDIPAVSSLAIPDYDSLSASQVVPRLAGLSADELEAVRNYEAGTRGRKTILNRVAQLQQQ